MKKVREELDTTDVRVVALEKQLVKGSKVMRAFKVGAKYEVHYFDPKNGLCKSLFAVRDYYKGR